MKLSIIITVYNEIETVETLIRKVIDVNLGVGWSKEIIVVDNVSTDGTRELLQALETALDITVIYQTVNLGKGNAFRTAIPFCNGNYIISQDADLEYEPQDIAKLVECLVNQQCDVVLGSRVIGKDRYHAYRVNEWGIKFLTWITNILFDTKYTDVATCYKLMNANKLKGLKLRSVAFNLDFELCGKYSKNQWKIAEVGITYNCRTIEEGRKTRNPYRHGVSALYTILRERLIR